MFLLKLLNKTENIDFRCYAANPPGGVWEDMSATVSQDDADYKSCISVLGKIVFNNSVAWHDTSSGDETFILSYDYK